MGNGVVNESVVLVIGNNHGWSCWLWIKMALEVKARLAEKTQDKECKKSQKHSKDGKNTDGHKMGNIDSYRSIYE